MAGIMFRWRLNVLSGTLASPRRRCASTFSFGSRTHSFYQVQKRTYSNEVAPGKINSWWNAKADLFRENPAIPPILLLLGIGFLEFLRRKGDYDKKNARKTEWQLQQQLVLHNWQVELLERLPLRALSSLWGKIVHIELPVMLRAPVYMLYAKVFGCDTSEMRDPLNSYPHLAAFFARKLKDGARKLDHCDLVSPVDGTVLHFGEITKNSMEQVKGVSYSLPALLGPGQPVEGLATAAERGHRLYHMIVYLAPGDYHGIHSPADWNITLRRHFAGSLFPVAPVVARLIKGLFSLNERVALAGQWKHGFFSITAVGATNVGSIVMSFDDVFKTNQRRRQGDDCSERAFTGDGIVAQRGAELAFFHMGSTVVLVFESPDFRFDVLPGQKLRLGQCLGSYVPPRTPTPKA